MTVIIFSVIFVCWLADSAGDGLLGQSSISPRTFAWPEVLDQDSTARTIETYDAALRQCHEKSWPEGKTDPSRRPQSAKLRTLVRSSWTRASALLTRWVLAAGLMSVVLVEDDPKVGLARRRWRRRRRCHAGDPLGSWCHTFNVH